MSDAVLDDIVALRRRIHARPELGLDLPETQRAVLDALDGLGLEVTTGTGLSSVTAVLRGGRPGPVVLLRADMDGLPIAEATGLDFAAVDGTMHACGHDLHVAGLVGAARLLTERRAELPGTVVFMFQPGEEGHAGGRAMIDEGVLDAAGERPVAAYAIHVDSTTPLGQFVSRPGPIMASASGMRLSIVGAGGHAAFPHLATDPVPAAAETVLALQTFVARRVPVASPAVVSVVRIASDSEAPNVLPGRVDIALNIRTLARETLQLLRAELPALVERVAAVHGCRAETEFVDSYPVTHNDPHETEGVLSLLEQRHGTGRVTRMPAPSMASEDFAYVLEEVPGTLLFLGACPEGVSDPAPMHSERTLFDDGVLGLQAATLAELAWRRLEGTLTP
ncbi:M20 metallopeptidase family protein [Microbacterium marinilacus]|uniref:M20 family metallopeptidase n=1 Tax=Microbacterium marinilacus TaxID=415209 RepID=A0ABP7BPH4_9MICO|nr:M20 family metallopeptidase [Microbacterium marinilacus]